MMSVSPSVSPIEIRPPAPRQRSIVLDVLRAIAVILVIGRHMTECPPSVSPILHGITQTWKRGGWVGVDIFFVLSGYLVSGLLFREYQKHGQLNIKQFLIRRGFKIYPAFYLFLLVTVVLAIIEDQIAVFATLRDLLFIQNYGPGLWPHTWSLAVEEHFYLLLVVVFAWLVRRPSRGSDPFALIPKLYLLTAIMCLGLRLITAFRLPFALNTHITPTHLRIDSLLLGVLLAYYSYAFPQRFQDFTARHRRLMLTAGVMLLIPAFCFELETTPLIYTFGFSLFAIGSALILAALIHAPIKPTLLLRMLAFVGAYSYSIYLWHAVVIMRGESLLATIPSVAQSWYAISAILFGGSLALGVIMAYAIEVPVLKLRDKIFPSRTP